MKIKFYWIGETKDKKLQGFEQDFLARIKRYVPAEIASVTEQKKKDPRSSSAQMVREGRKLLAMIPRGAQLVVLDETGKNHSSRELAAWLEKSLAGGSQELAFVVGGYQGIPEELKNKADKILSLSRMTFPHEIARTLLLEQVYRAISINMNLPYHK